MVNHLRIGAALLAPWIVLENKNFQDCIGILCDLVKYLAKSMNFTYDFISEAGGSGVLLANGSWTGLISKFVKGVG